MKTDAESGRYKKYLPSVVNGKMSHTNSDKSMQGGRGVEPPPRGHDEGAGAHEEDDGPKGVNAVEHRCVVKQTFLHTRMRTDGQTYRRTD